jgi:hypothetical protein
MTRQRPQPPATPALGESSRPSRPLTSGELQACGYDRPTGKVWVATDHAGVSTIWQPTPDGYSRIDDPTALAGLRGYWQGETHAQCTARRGNAEYVTRLLAQLVDEF